MRTEVPAEITNLAIQPNSVFARLGNLLLHRLELIAGKEHASLGTLRLELASQRIEVNLQVPNVGLLCHFLVHLGAIQDVLRRVGILERRQRFLNRLLGRRYCGDQNRLRASAQRFLQETGKFAFPVRNMPVPGFEKHATSRHSDCFSEQRGARTLGPGH